MDDSKQSYIGGVLLFIHRIYISNRSFYYEYDVLRGINNSLYYYYRLYKATTTRVLLYS